MALNLDRGHCLWPVPIPGGVWRTQHGEQEVETQSTRRWAEIKFSKWQITLFQVVGRCSKYPCKVDSDIKASCFLLCKECTVYLHVTLNSAVHLFSLQRKCSVWYAPYCWNDMFFTLYVSYHSVDVVCITSCMSGSGKYYLSFFFYYYMFSKDIVILRLYS